MKKRLIALLAVAALMLCVLAGCGEPEYISEDRAKEIAVEDAYHTTTEVTGLSAQLVEEEETAYYIVEFSCDGMDYKYQLDAKTGEIQKYPTEFMFEEGIV